MIQKWHFKQKYPPEFADKLPGYHSIILQLLYDRGLDNQDKIDEFLNPDYSQDLYNPFLFQDMKKAVDRILLAIKNNQKIYIYGDYDADGITSSVVLEKTLQKLVNLINPLEQNSKHTGREYKNIKVFIPHREIDGYGLNINNVEKIIEQKYNLVITVDCGITNNQQIKKLKDNNIDTIVVDHHLEAEELPSAYAILNCSLKREKYPFKKLAGVGMVFKLVQTLLKEVKLNFKTKLDLEAFEKWLLDLVAIGTIGDVSPILSENRTLVRYGLMVLNKTPRKGLQELIRTCNLSNDQELKKDLPLGVQLYDLNIYNISYQIVPRINAAGRIDHANLAYKLLTTEDELEAIALARDIHEKNLERQKIVEQTMAEAKEIFGHISDVDRILIAAKQNWLSGVVGLVAGKLKDELCRPVILFAVDNDKKYTGSGRSIKEFNITNALHQCDEFIQRCGGHSQACGLVIIGEKNYNKFMEKITQAANQELKNVELVPSLEIDAKIKLKDLNWELWDELEKFEPFAEANPRPLFLIKKVRINNIEIVGKNGDHLRFYLFQDNNNYKAISFGTARKWNNLKKGDVIDIVVEFGVNEWNGNRELQLKVVDCKKEIKI